jgi:acetyl-CoA carboxylase alpha subunit
MDDETKALLRNIAHHLKWVIVLLVAILAMLIGRGVGGS